MAETKTRGESGVDCSEKRTRMCWRNVFGRGAAKGNKFECFLGDDTSTWMWNWRVPGEFARPCKSASRRFMLWTRGKSRRSRWTLQNKQGMVYYDYIRMVEYKKTSWDRSMSSKLAVHLCNICKRVPRTLHSFNVLFLKQCVDRLGMHA